MAGQASRRLVAMPEPDAAPLQDATAASSDQALGVEALDATAAGRHVAAWSDLAARCLEPNPFMEPGFCLPAASHLVPPGTVAFVLVWQPRADTTRRLVAVCPLFRSTVPGWPVADIWFHDLTALGTPLLCREAAASALLALLGWIEDHDSRRFALMVTALDRDGPTAGLLDATARETGREIRFLDERRRAVLIGPDPGAPAGLGALSARRVKELQRQRRRLIERGALRYESAADSDAIRAALPRFLALETQGWKGKAGTSLVQDARRAAFVGEMVDRMAAHGRCRIDSLLLDDEPIAMGILLSSGDRDYFWKTAFAETLGPLSPGVQFVLDLTQVQEGRHDVTLTDSCAIPDHPMIDRLWPQRVVIADALIEIRPGSGLRYRLASGLEQARRRGRARIKALYRRIRPPRGRYPA